MLTRLKQHYESFKESLQDYFMDDAQEASCSAVTSQMPDYPFFCDELTYQYFDEETHLFINRLSSGLMYRITPLTGLMRRLPNNWIPF